MAPKIFSLLVDATLSWVLSLIIYQIILAWNLNDDSKGLQDSLTMIRAVLQDADEQQHRREPVRLWLKKLKDVAYEGEAVLNKLKNDDIRQMVEMLDQSGTERLRDARLCQTHSCIIFSANFCFYSCQLEKKKNHSTEKKACLNFVPLIDKKFSLLLAPSGIMTAKF
ncbi:disease resistance protein RGA2-like isoform X5 [Hevea brasiliensis]|uniref:disease resistance protein RGA2-like isoform X5 n=1 Tax=Hevea brasiliensis TaxID=3981 RepID=UPI0025D3887B|nr:disease resistance protein RGA2-like isoform X5 [Hevea brasiliensis]